MVTVMMILSAAIALPSAVLLLMVGYEILFAPPVIEYKDMPFAVGTAAAAPGDAVSVVVTRCANDPFATDPLTYTFTREIVNVDTGVKTAVPPGSATVSKGCETVISNLNFIPRSTMPGHYYLEGTSTATGRFKTTTASWQSAVFEVR